VRRVQRGRSERGSPKGNATAWRIDLRDDGAPVEWVRLVLPPDFPASPCGFEVDRKYFLRVPHINADGSVCMGLRSIPADYDDPVGAVVRALRRLQDELLEPAKDPLWVAEQFHDERTSYWFQHWLQRRDAGTFPPVPPRSCVDVAGLGAWKEVPLVAYVRPGSKRRRYDLQLASVASDTPEKIADRHRWSSGMRVRGNALFVRLPDSLQWTPASWPKTLGELEDLVSQATASDCSVTAWLRRVGWADDNTKEARATPRGQRPLLIVLVQAQAHFGFRLFRYTTPLVRKPVVEPVFLTRIDADWVLARDTQLDVLHARRRMQVLLLGCGSLGSPLARALARSGIAMLHMVDKDWMESENTSRHELGLRDAWSGKAGALAERLLADVPGIEVKGYLAEAGTWLSRNCKAGDYDLVVDCTAESSVRVLMAHMRLAWFGDAPVVHAWTEPLCSAGHVVLTQPDMRWPDSDPADALINASDLSADDTRIDLPGCSASFHPYGVADIDQVAAFAAERLFSILDDPKQRATVWSWVRSSAFFTTLDVPVNLRPIVPQGSSRFDSTTITRELATVLGQG
jgi:molybdopterin/thiamine biosynthesis adenylyltransferase